MIKINLKFFLFFFLIFSFYLVYKTGLHGDDLTFISNLHNKGFYYFLSVPYINVGYEISLLFLPGYYFFWWPYWLFGLENQIFYDILKAFFLLSSFYFIFKFCSDYFSQYKSILFSLFFIFYPSHDTTTYWYITSTYILVPALIMYSHYLINKKFYNRGFIINLFACFAFYTSPPFVFGLSIIFLLNKEIKKFFYFVLPGFFYLFYYFFFYFFTRNIERRINDEVSLLKFIKNCIIQFLSSIDAAIGPSFWLKVYWSTTYLSLFTFILSLIVIIFFIFTNTNEKLKKSPLLIIAFFSTFILSILMIALTGEYTQTAFNLGNRITTYVSFFISFLIIYYINSRKLLSIIIIIFFLPIFGISDYWKSWNNKQIEILANIDNNILLEKLNFEDTLIIYNNAYSKFGPFDHIEFFSMPWNIKSIFKNKVKTKKIIPMVSYITIDNNMIIDQKFGGKIELGNKIFLYDSNTNNLKKIDYKKLTEIINDKKLEKRHWLQLLSIPFLEKIVLYLNPNLQYLFSK